MGRLSLVTGRPVLILSAFLLAFSACTAPSPAEVVATVDPTPQVGDAAAIWCNYARWRVIGVADSLGFPVPTTNPPHESFAEVFVTEADRLTEAYDGGEITLEEYNLGVEEAMKALEVPERRYESGEWDRSGVLDGDWEAWGTERSEAYARGCAAAYEQFGWNS